MKPRLFIGSSSEALPVARAIQTLLARDVVPQIWTAGAFPVGGTTLPSLHDKAAEVDFAVLVFQPDDVIHLRKETAPATRDNVVLEFGLFYGALGPGRVFAVLPDSEQHIPTDLHGVTMGYYSVPEDEADLVHELGAFCNEVRLAIKRSGPRTRTRSAGVVAPAAQPEPAQMAAAPLLKQSAPKPPRLRITDAPTVFFNRRVQAAFPGVRGVRWYEDPPEAADRIVALLQPPIMFDEADGYGVTADPIWWFRGGSSLHIASCTKVGPKRLLLDSEEFEIDRIAVLRTNAYWQDCVYVQTSADSPIGLYAYTEEDRSASLDQFGYINEEYGLFEGTPITRECYDDGHAEIGGKVVDTGTADLRIRYLTKYNFLIASKFSPINSAAFDRASRPVLNAALADKSAAEALLNAVSRMLKNNHDD